MTSGKLLCDHELHYASDRKMNILWSGDVITGTSSVAHMEVSIKTKTNQEFVVRPDLEETSFPNQEPIAIWQYE